MGRRGALARHLVLPYIVAQLVGAVLGAWLAHAMFDLRVLQWSGHARTGAGQWLAELVATSGLLLVVLRAPAQKVAGMLAVYIGAACWFTASTAFANPAAVFGRDVHRYLLGHRAFERAGFRPGRSRRRDAGSGRPPWAGPDGLNIDSADCRASP